MADCALPARQGCLSAPAPAPPRPGQRRCQLARSPLPPPCTVAIMIRPNTASTLRSASYLVVLCLALPACAGEPRYHGKTLSKWIRSNGSPTEQIEAEAAIRSIGTNALPFLIRWLTETSGDNYQHVPNAFAALGEAAAPAVPA